MKIKGTEKREVQIELSQSDFDKLMIKRLYELYEWNPEFFIKDEKVQYEEEVIGSHRYWDVSTVRDATKEDKKIFKLIESVKAKIYK